MIDDKYEEVEFIPPNKDWMLMGVRVTLSYNSKEIIEYFEKKVTEYKY